MLILAVEANPLDELQCVGAIPAWHTPFYIVGIINSTKHYNIVVYCTFKVGQSSMVDIKTVVWVILHLDLGVFAYNVHACMFSYCSCQCVSVMVERLCRLRRPSGLRRV